MKIDWKTIGVRFIHVTTDGGLPSRWAIVTACDPHGQPATIQANNQATDALREYLITHGHNFFPVTGGSLSGDHEEQGFGVALTTIPEARDLGKKFRQDAVFWYEDGIVSLVFCQSNTPPVVIGRWEDLL